MLKGQELLLNLASDNGKLTTMAGYLLSFTGCGEQTLANQTAYILSHAKGVFWAVFHRSKTVTK